MKLDKVVKSDTFPHLPLEDDEKELLQAKKDGEIQTLELNDRGDMVPVDRYEE